MNIASYPKIFALGHPSISELFLDPVIVEEKIDGSQFSFCVEAGEIKMRSKGVEVLAGAEGMFLEAANQVRALAARLTPGWVYRTEYLQKPKHNTLAYDRIPFGHLILFDLTVGVETYTDYETKKLEAEHLGIECVPLLYSGRVENAEALYSLLETKSVLGGQTIEGFVIKNYARFGADKKVLMGKYVSEKFKEKNKTNWKTEHPARGDVIRRLIGEYRTPARWDKAIIHLKERGELEHSPRDIGKLITEAMEDLEKECSEEIRASLYAWAIKDIRRGVTAGLPEYYKKRLLEAQF